jgi:prepilin-type N-terminal cleavage/methylation domain-containing protein
MQKGFSLAEILVSISIISILSGIGIQTYTIAQRSAKLKADVITVTSAIRIAQNRALSPSTGDLGIGANDNLCAMGVAFNNSQKLRFYYKVEQSSGICGGSPNYYGTEIILSSANFGASLGEFEFGLPFADNRSTATSLQLELSGVATKTIIVTNSGLIKVN